MAIQAVSTQGNLTHFNAEKKLLLKNTICKGATDDQLELFIHACTRSGLDPFMRQIYAVQRKDWKTGENIMTIQTGIDGYRLIAERTGKYMPGKEYSFSYDKDGRLLSATAYVKKLGPDGQWHEIAYTVFLSEYMAKDKDGKPIAQWKDKPHVMLGKCAESAVLRKAFPADMSGLYTKEEMDQADIEHAVPLNVETGEITSKEDEPIGEEKGKEIEETLAKHITPIDPAYRANLLSFYGKDSFSKISKKSMNGLAKSIARKIDNVRREEITPVTDQDMEEVLNK